MVLAFLDLSIPYSQLLRLLRVDKIGTPFRNLRYLESFQLSVTIATGNMATLREQLRQGHPLILAVDTAELPYWQESTDHAVVVVGVNEQHVYLVDPDTGADPYAVAVDEFELAWLEKDYLYAVIQR
jgi:ABC-type bacteriocin/lantibiotic exporter with double-glycine peptidase domain